MRNCHTGFYSDCTSLHRHHILASIGCCFLHKGHSYWGNMRLAEVKTFSREPSFYRNKTIDKWVLWEIKELFCSKGKSQSNKEAACWMAVSFPTKSQRPANKTLIPDMRSLLFSSWPGLSKRIPKQAAYCCCPWLSPRGGWQILLLGTIHFWNRAQRPLS